MNDKNSPAPPKDLTFEPVKRGGYNFTTHRMKATREGNLVFVPTLALWIVSLVFILAPIPFCSVFFLTNAAGEGGHKFMVAVIVLFFWIIGGIFLRNVFPRARFDFERRAYYRSCMVPGYGHSCEDKKDFTPFSRIAGLQIVTEVCRGSKGSRFSSYELNLVSTEGKRINITDHNSWETLRKDAIFLAEKLGCPLWEEDPDTVRTNIALQRDQKKKSFLVSGGIFLFMGGLFFTFAVLVPFIQYSRSLFWEPKEAIVKNSYIDTRTTTRKGRKKKSYCIKVEYSYFHNGKRYTAMRYQLPENYTEYMSRTKRRIVRQYPPGKKIICFVDPSNPKEAAIHREFLNAEVVLPGIFSLIFMSVGLGILLKGRSMKE